jgi:general secretion pathway protein M
MRERLHAWWTGLARRERMLVVAAVVVVAGGMLYALAIEPAWRARVRIAGELPKLQEQLAEIEALREEARLLRSQGIGVDRGTGLRAGAEKSLARAGIAATVQSDPGRADSRQAITVTASGVPAGAWIAWMEEFGRESRARIVRAKVERGGAPGAVAAEAGFEVPSR